jgi:acyl carrier protein
MIEAEIMEIVARRLKKDIATLTPETNLKKDLGADSIDSVEVVFEIEETYGIEIEDSVAETINTIGDAINVIKELRE